MSDEPDLVKMTIEVVASYVAHNLIAPDDVPNFIAKTHAAIKDLSNAPEPEAPAAGDAPAFTPAVTVRKSLASREHILSLIDGKPYKTLKRHLSGHGLTPAEYRQRYNLKADYPMVAPAYSDHRREVAKTLGLGRAVTGVRTAEAVAPPAPVEEAPAAETPTTPKRGRNAAAPKPVASSAAPAVEATAVEHAVVEPTVALKPARSASARKSAAKRAAPARAVAEPAADAPEVETPSAESVAAETPIAETPTAEARAAKPGRKAASTKPAASKKAPPKKTAAKKTSPKSAGRAKPLEAAPNTRRAGRSKPSQDSAAPENADT